MAEERIGRSPRYLKAVLITGCNKWMKCWHSIALNPSMVVLAPPIYCSVRAKEKVLRTLSGIRKVKIGLNNTVYP
jgi:hypothetical protein